MNYGYLIIAVLYLILTFKQDDATKFWLYAGIGAVYFLMGARIGFFGNE